MRVNRSLVKILLAGMPVLGIAVWVRLHHVAVRKPPPPPPEVIAPQILELDAQLSRLQAAVAKSPKDSAARLALADFFQKIGRADKTAEQLEVVARLEPDRQEAQIALGTAHLALMQPKEAEVVFRTVTRRWQRNVQGWQGLATAFYHQKRFLEAVTADRVAVSLDTREPNGRYILATSLLEYALQFPDPMEHMAALKEARDNFRMVLAAWPEQGDIYYRLARTSMEMHDKRMSIKNFRRAMELLPEKPEIPWQLAQAYNMAGDKTAARKVLAEAIVKHPRYAGLHDMLGKLLLASGEPGADQTALEHFRTAVQIAPGVPAFQERYGTSCLRVNQLDEARTAFERAQQLDPNRVYPYQQLSAVYTRLGDQRKASLAARTAVQMTFNDQQLKRFMAESSANPDNVNLHMILAERYQQLKMKGAAKDELLMILQRDPSNKLARRELEQLASVARTEPTAPK